jgi:hypothetical protein
VGRRLTCNQIEGGRLYGAHLLGIRYDKYVHFVNAFAANALICRLFQVQHITLTRVNRPFAMRVVPGLGAVIEIVESMAIAPAPAHRHSAR